MNPIAPGKGSYIQGQDEKKESSPLSMNTVLQALPNTEAKETSLGKRKFSAESKAAFNMSDVFNAGL